MAHIYVKGNLGTDPEVRVSDKGEFVTFPLYENDFRRSQQKRATQYQVAVYSSLKDYCLKYLTSGCRVFVGGKFRAKKAENGATFLHITLEEVELLKRPNRSSAEARA
ncbi:single-stranded DNA-binding protein [bacterium]|nr:single-stranded DNA-binding protein [bacterium]